MKSRTKLAIVTLVAVAACAKATSTAMNGGSTSATPAAGGMAMAVARNASIAAPMPDRRVGLKPGSMDSSGRYIATPAAEAIWNLKMVSHTPLPLAFQTATTSDLAFSGNNVIQGNYNGFLVWDISNPAAPTLKVGDECPASQDDVSVFNNLLFVSAEATNSRLDCGKTGVPAPISKDRIRGVRIFDITDIAHPKQIAQVQTCRGSHTHTLVTDPTDKANVYIYISGTSGVRSPEELPGCDNGAADDPNTALFRIEVIKVPLAHPELAAIVSSPRIFAEGANPAGLASPRGHGAAPQDTTKAACDFATATAAKAAADSAAGRGGRGGRGGGVGRGGAGGGNVYASLGLTATSTKADSTRAQQVVDSLKGAGVLQSNVTLASLAGAPAGRGGRNGGGRNAGRGAAAAPGPNATGGCAVAAGRGGRGGAGGAAGGSVLAGLALNPASTKADTTRVQTTVDSLKRAGILQATVTPATFAFAGGRGGGGRGANPGAGKLTQCHDITVYPGVGLAGGACAGMGLLLDIKDAAHPRRIDAVADSNFSFWHSATFSNDGSMVLFSDEWGGGSAAYCRATDPKSWGADAIFKITDGKMKFQNYYKMPAAQTPAENCVAHNGSLIPIPGRTIMVQAFYQGGLTVFEWSDPAHPVELAYFDRGPYAPYFVDGGYWSAYWYNGHIVGSEIKRGMDIFELTPSAAISQNEIDAAKTVHFTQLNVQDQPKFVWPASFALARSYVDQLERDNGTSAANIASTRAALDAAEKAAGGARKDALKKLATELKGEEAAASDKGRAGWLTNAVADLAKL